MKPFRSVKTTLGDLDAEAAATLITAAADVALVLDDRGVVHDVAFQTQDLADALEGDDSWAGRPWASTVTVESRPKAAALLREAVGDQVPRWRHLNHPSPNGPDTPVQYSAVRIGPGRTVVFGRDLRPLSELQQRLVNAQQSMEQDYSRIRQFETRYRLLFQTSPDPLFILDAFTLRIVESNPAGTALVSARTKRRGGFGVTGLFAEGGAESLRVLLAAVRTSGRPDDGMARLAGGGEVRVRASLFREEQASFFLMRLSTAQGEGRLGGGVPANAVPGAAIASAVPGPGDEAALEADRLKAKLLKLVESAPDGFVVTDNAGRIITANAAFLRMTQMPSGDQLKGESLDRFLGRPGVELNLLIASLRQRGSVRLFATTLRDEHGISMDVEISATTVINGGQPCMGFTIREVARRVSAPPRGGKIFARSAEQLTELIGRVALKDLVREAADVVERMCIETAIEMTGDNRASAAEILGLSRQSLYVKMRRYGLGDLSPNGAG